MGVVISKYSCFKGEPPQYTNEFIDPNSIPIAGAVPNANLASPDSGKASFNLVKKKEGETQKEQVRSFVTCYKCHTGELSFQDQNKNMYRVKAPSSYKVYFEDDQICACAWKPTGRRSSVEI